MTKTKDELVELNELCKYCPYTEYGTKDVNTGPWNLCEGVACDESYANYLQDYESEDTICQ